jgi:hypothetical protein
VSVMATGPFFPSKPRSKLRGRRLVPFASKNIHIFGVAARTQDAVRCLDSPESSMLGSCRLAANLTIMLMAPCIVHSLLETYLFDIACPLSCAFGAAARNFFGYRRAKQGQARSPLFSTLTMMQSSCPHAVHLNERLS